MNEKKTSKSYDWLRQIPSSLLLEDQIPLLGSPPPFPWEEFSTKFSQMLGIEDFSISFKDIQWRSEKDFFTEIANPLSLHFIVNGIEDAFSWIMSKADISALIAHLIHGETNPQLITDDDMFSAFYQFMAIEALHTISNLEFDRSLSIHLVEKEEFPKSAALCLDVGIRFLNKTIFGRFLFSSNFRKSWAERYASKTTEAYLDSFFASQLNLTLHIEVGQLQLSRNLWDKIQLGDFVLIDNCSIDPNTHEGQGRLLLKGLPLFGIKFQNNKVEIADVSEFQQVKRHQGVTKIMPNPKNPKEFDEEEFDFEDENFDESEFEESEFDEDDEDDEDFDFTMDDDDDDNESEFSIEETLHKERKATEKKKEEAKEVVAPKKNEDKIVSETSSEIFSPDEIPLSISVEIGRFQMSIKKLAELAPGNLLELGVRPENGVDLIVNGKCIARAELLRIGDTLGVRILEKI